MKNLCTVLKCYNGNKIIQIFIISILTVINLNTKSHKIFDVNNYLLDIIFKLNFCIVYLEPVYAVTGGSNRAWSPLESEAALREAASLPLARWRAPAIIAWLELALGMPQYAAAVADNVKSGKVRLFFLY